MIRGPDWVTGYQRSWLRGDVIAGFTVTAYLVPQVMAYADLAGLPAATGLWAAVGALIGYALLGTSPTLSAGPESTTALMTAAALGSVAATSGRVSDMGVALAFAVAALCFLGWLGHLSTLAQLLSRPVLVGYMSGIAAIMVVSQLGKLIGISARANGFLPELREVVTQLGSVHLPTLAVGAVTLAVMLAGAAAYPRAPIALIGMLGATLAVWALDLEKHGVHVIGAVPTTFPTSGLPQVSTHSVLDLIGPALGIAFVGYTDIILTARAFATSSGHRIDDRRELLAVVYAAVRLVDVGEFRRYARFRRSELLLALATTAAVLAVGVLVGVLVAIGLSILDLLRRVARPHDAIEGHVPGLAGMHDIDDFPDAKPVAGLVVYRYDSPLFFANAEDFRARARAAVSSAPEPVHWFVLNTEAIVEVDITAVDALEALRSELVDSGIVFGLARIKQDLRAALAPSGLLERIGEEHLFPTLPTAVAAYQAWLRDEEARG
jgi:SulP family sulfate permease